MGSMNVKIKVMPSSVETNLEEIKNKTKDLIEKSGGKGVNFEEEPIAFGLKAVIVFFVCPEDQELESLENEMKKIEDVNSVEVIDIRRAIG